MATMEPPPFQEASRCDVCKSSFSAFRRRKFRWSEELSRNLGIGQKLLVNFLPCYDVFWNSDERPFLLKLGTLEDLLDAITRVLYKVLPHHCRCCGRTLCAEHSSDQMALPQFGIYSNVRVCADCCNDGSRWKDIVAADTPNKVIAVSDSISRLSITQVSGSKLAVGAEKSIFPGISECKCGMPLCICEAPAPLKDSMQPQQSTTTSNFPLNSTPKQKKTEPTPRSRGSTSNRLQSTLLSPGQLANSSVDIQSIKYEVTGEGLREAIKNGDTVAAKKLLSQGVDANYCDKQRSSLLHLAAVFNQTEIAFALIDHGARLDGKNSQGETPLDCAPATLQYKMKKKTEEDMQSHGHQVS
ncbi:hypothetical protein OROGR_023880 [Orobanche gracilis]